MKMAGSKTRATRGEVENLKPTETQVKKEESELTDGELDAVSAGKISGMNKSTDVTLKRGAVGTTVIGPR